MLSCVLYCKFIKHIFEPDSSLSNLRTRTPENKLLLKHVKRLFCISKSYKRFCMPCSSKLALYVIVIFNVWGSAWQVCNWNLLWADMCPGGLVLLFINIAARLLMDIIGENRTGLLTFNFLCKIKEVAENLRIGCVCLGSSQGVYITLCGFHFLGENWFNV